MAIAFQPFAWQEDPSVGIVGGAGAGAIASAESFGTAKVVRWVGPAGIASATAFGTTKALRLTGPAGVSSSTAFGTAKVWRVGAPVGVVSTAAFGRPTVTGPGIVTNSVYPHGFTGGAGWGDEGWQDPWGGGTVFGTPTVTERVFTGLLLTDLRNTDGVVTGLLPLAAVLNGLAVLDDDLTAAMVMNGTLGDAGVSDDDLTSVAVSDSLLYSQIETSALAVI